MAVYGADGASGAFYASLEKIHESNKLLEKSGSFIRFITPDLAYKKRSKAKARDKFPKKFKRVTVRKQTLYQVIPYWTSRENLGIHGPRSDDEGLYKRNTNLHEKNLKQVCNQRKPMHLWYDCGKSSAAVMGSNTLARQGIFTNEDGKVEATEEMPDPTGIANSIFKSVLPGFLRDNPKYITKEHKPVYKKGDETVLTNFGGLNSGTNAKIAYWNLPEEARDKFERMVGFNRYAQPEVGQAYAMATYGDLPGWESHLTQSFPYHWGGVVAIDGADRVVLQAAARQNDEFDASAESWSFTMYGQKKGQTFFERWGNDGKGHFGNYYGTIVVRNTDKKDGATKIGRGVKPLHKRKGKPNYGLLGMGGGLMSPPPMPGSPGVPMAPPMPPQLLPPGPMPTSAPMPTSNAKPAPLPTSNVKPAPLPTKPSNSTAVPETPIQVAMKGLGASIDTPDVCRLVMNTIGFDTIKTIGADIVGVVCNRALKIVPGKPTLLRIAGIATKDIAVWQFLEDLVIKGRLGSVLDPLAVFDKSDNLWRASGSNAAVDAYLADLADSAFLSEVEGDALARHLRVQATIYSESGGHQKTKKFADINTGQLYRERGITKPDGHCLIHGMYQITDGRNATREEVKSARQAIAQSLDRNLLAVQVESYISASIAGFPVGGLGVRFRSLLEADVGIQVAKSASIQRSLGSHGIDIGSVGPSNVVSSAPKHRPKYLLPKGHQRICLNRIFNAGGLYAHSGYLVHVNGDHYICVEPVQGHLEAVEVEDGVHNRGPKSSESDKVFSGLIHSVISSIVEEVEVAHPSVEPEVKPEVEKKKKKKKKKKPKLGRIGTLARLDHKLAAVDRPTQRSIRAIIQGLAPSDFLGSKGDLDRFVLHWAQRTIRGEFGSLRECRQEFFLGGKTDALIVKMKKAIKRSSKTL